MPPVRTVVVVLCLLGGCGDPGQVAISDNVATQRQEIVWNSYDLTDGVPRNISSPDGKLMLSYQDSSVEVRTDRSQSLVLDVVPPASVVFSPTSNYVAINNGNGSGQTSTLLLVGRVGALSQHDGTDQRLKKFYVERTGCEIELSSVSARAEGWSADGFSLWVQFENWSRKTFCDGDRVFFAEYDVRNQTFPTLLSRTEALEKFCPQQGFRKRFGPNCTDHSKAI